MENNLENFNRNIDRVNSLCKLYNSLRQNDSKEGKDYKFTDVLRSAVVLLHSAFEEYFRNVLKNELKSKCTQEDLQRVHFLTKDGKHIDKISVGNLLQYKGKTVDELIEEFISETLDTTSFNNYSDIVSWSQKMKVDLSEFDSQEKIGKMIERRHKIVHEADNNKADTNSEKYSLMPIQEKTVSEWTSAVKDLVNIIDKQIGGNE